MRLNSSNERLKQVCIVNVLIMKTLSCRDAGCDCDYVAKGETEEDVLRDTAQHGMKEHGKTDNDMTRMRDNLKASIRTSL
jgi:predicted small metal-binding protein